MEHEDRRWEQLWFARLEQSPKEDLEIRGQVETINTWELLRSAGILRRVLETWGDLKKLTVTQTPVNDYQLTLVGKTLKGVK